MQLGGPRVMGVNGVSHHTVDDDLEGVKVILRWLSYAPPQLGAEPPVLPSSDPVDRSVLYLPAAHEKLDPRAAIAGKEQEATAACRSYSSRLVTMLCCPGGCSVDRWCRQPTYCSLLMHAYLVECILCTNWW